MSTDVYLQLVRRHMEAENGHRMEETLATLTPNCLFNTAITCSTLSQPAPDFVPDVVFLFKEG